MEDRRQSRDGFIMGRQRGGRRVSHVPVDIARCYLTFLMISFIVVSTVMVNFLDVGLDWACTTQEI